METQVIEMEVMVKVIETATISLKVLGTPSCLQKKHFTSSTQHFENDY